VLQQIISLSGLLVMIALAWACSTNRWRVLWLLVVKGVALQFLFAWLILRTEPGKKIFDGAGAAIQFVLDASKEGTSFVFGSLADRERFGVIFFIQVTGTIILVSALMSALYYIGVMQWVVWAMAKIMQVVMGTSGSESLSSAANVFVGQTEAPLVIKPYLARMTQSELMAVMSGGMATIAGGVMALYVDWLAEAGFARAAGDLLAASVMSAPASLVIAKIMVPETEESETRGHVEMRLEREGSNILDAICHGASEGLKLSLNVMAMLIAFVALVFLCNKVLSGLGWIVGVDGLSLEGILGWLFRPLALAMGISWDESATVGAILGKRTILNELLAYRELAELHQAGEVSARATMITTYALCGFANFASIAIQIGGIGSLVPSRRADLARYGLRAMIAGTLASFMTATIAGALVR
jgi:CNT family concentrative nucleoside transporter